MARFGFGDPPRVESPRVEAGPNQSPFNKYFLGVSISMTCAGIMTTHYPSEAIFQNVNPAILLLQNDTEDAMEYILIIVPTLFLTVMLNTLLACVASKPPEWSATKHGAFLFSCGAVLLAIEASAIEDLARGYQLTSAELMTIVLSAIIQSSIPTGWLGLGILFFAFFGTASAITGLWFLLQPKSRHRF